MTPAKVIDSQPKRVRSLHRPPPQQRQNEAPTEKPIEARVIQTTANSIDQLGVNLLPFTPDRLC
ncbi:MAG: hypothetical protein MUF72_23070 [Elainella sp. Prado103]|nr:hypothetical protein [Elainella sp. Prado103]